MKRVCVVLCEVLLCACWAWGQVASSVAGALVTIENERYRLTFDPARGGRCSSFVLKAAGTELVYDGPTAGFFQDHFAHQSYPGELLSSRYDYALEKTADAVTLRLWTTAAADKLTAGLKVEKAITLRAGHREITVVNRFANDTREGKNVALWVQHCFGLSGDRYFDFYYRPAATGISLDGMDDRGEHKIPPSADDYAQDWVKEPVAGWSANRDRRTNDGMVFLMDYAYLKTLYNCANSYTVEWFMDRVPLPGGTSWATEQVLIPIHGFTGFTHASRRLIANLEVTSQNGETRLTHQLAGALTAPGPLTVRTRVYGVRSHRETALAPLTVDGVGLEPVSIAQTWPSAQTEPLVCRVEIAGTGWSERYEYLYQGTFAAQGIQGSGSAAEYSISRPKKAKVFFKPAQWARPRHAHPRVMVLYGLYTQHYRVEDAVKALDPQAEVKIYDGWDFFPPTYEELLDYDVLVLANVPAGPDYANEMVADFVRHGGGLVTLGGMHSYGSGQWAETPLADLLPVTLQGTFDLARERHGVKPASRDPLLAGIAWPKNARFYWVHPETPKPGSRTVLTAGRRPLVVLGPCGEGRVACLLATCHGEALPGQQEAWRTAAWVAMLSRVLGWTIGK